MRLEVLLSGVVLVTSATSVAALQIPVKGDLGSWFHEDIAVADIDCDNGVCPLKTHSAYDEFLQHCESRLKRTAHRCD